MTYRFGRALHLNQAHAAIASNRKSLMVAETGNLNARLLASLVNSVRSVHSHWLAVDVNLELVAQCLRCSETYFNQLIVRVFEQKYGALAIKYLRLTSCGNISKFSLLENGLWALCDTDRLF